MRDGKKGNPIKKEKVTYEQVAAVAERFVSEGKNPTIFAIYNELGTAGSKSMVYRHLSKWKTGCHSGVPVDKAEKPRENLLAFFIDETNRIKAVARAKTEYLLAQAQADSVKATLITERDIADEQVAMLRIHHQKALATIEKQAEEIARLRNIPGIRPAVTKLEPDNGVCAPEIELQIGPPSLI